MGRGEVLRSELDWSAFGTSTEFASLPLAVWWIVNLTFYGFGEEVGWRGFLQPRLEQRFSVGTAAGLVSLPSAVWRPSSVRNHPGLPAMPLVGFLGFAASIWVASWIFAWLLHLGQGQSVRGRRLPRLVRRRHHVATGASDAADDDGRSRSPSWGWCCCAACSVNLRPANLADEG